MFTEAATSKASKEEASKKREAKPPAIQHLFMPQGAPLMTDLQRAAADPRTARPPQILSLQRNYGNEAVQRLLVSHNLQAKLTVGAANDAYEQEADRVAAQVMSAPAHAPGVQRVGEEEEIQAKPLAASITPLIQRQTIPEEEEEKPLQGKFTSEREMIDPGTDFESRLAATRGNGRPLPKTTREFMEQRFSTDFSAVRLHTDGESAELNREIGAQAFTCGPDIYLGEGKYSPSPIEGQKLLAHELAHTIQQGSVVQRRVIQRAGSEEIERLPPHILASLRASGLLPAEKREVAKWAKEEYKAESKRTVICSMTPDGKIGSVYFGKKGRIRTTHPLGPQQEKHQGLETIQFNINESLAISEFERAYPQSVKSKDFWRDFHQWLAKRLKGVSVDNAPAWATLVESPDTAYHGRPQDIPKNKRLFEIFKNINGKVERWHPSRGIAAKFETDKQTIYVLRAAIKHIDGIKDPKERNIAFYKFVKSRLPKFVGYMRHPNEVA